MGKLLDDFLTKNKKDTNTVGKSLNKNLLTVEATIAKRQQAIAEAQKSIKENAINIKAISEATGISRKTFYNNELLAAFVEENATVNNASADEIKRLKDRLAEAESKMFTLLSRDADMEELRYQISRLEAGLKTSHKRIRSLEEQHEDDLRKMNKPVVKKKEHFDA